MRKKKKILTTVFIILCMISLGCRTTPESAPEPITDAASSATPSPDLLPSPTTTPPTVTAAPENMEESGIKTLHVEGTCLVDDRGNPIQLKGISTHGIAWFPNYINRQCFQQLHEEWNVNVIRLAMYTAENGGYCTDGDRESLKTVVRNGVTFATEQDMYVIIDWHILWDSNPNTYLEEAKAFFEEMSGEYGSYDNILYEICNEPSGNTTWQEVKDYADEIIPIIRANDENAVILVGTPNGFHNLEQVVQDPITTFDNILYSPHFYATTHREDLRAKLVAAAEAGLPLFVSEYGICDASGNGAIDVEQANQWIDAMNRYNISYVAWSLSNKDESSAIFKSTCRKISGFTVEDLSTSGEWLYHMLTDSESSASPTGIIDRPEEKSGTADKDIEMEVTLSSSWQENETDVYQYSLTLTNSSNLPLSQWAVDIRFNEDIILKDGWNGEYSTEGNILHITSMDYNGEIPVGGSLSDIGFIVAGGNEILISG